MLIVLYFVAIVAANLLVAQFGPNVSIVNALVLIGLDLTVRDALHERWHGRLWPRMTVLLVGGSALSYLLNANAGPIALASLIAFAGAGVADTLTYVLLHDRARLVRVNGSNVVSAAADSLLFPALAFGWPPLWGIVVGQFLAKVVGGAFWSMALRGRASR